MKNLNRKLSVIALSGMAVFGGVAVSGVQAFAAPIKAVEQDVKEVQDVDVAKVQKMIIDLNFGGIYKAVKSSDNKNELINEAAQKYQGSKFFRRGSFSLNKNRPDKSLNRILSGRHAAVVVKLGERYVLIEGMEDEIVR